MYAHKIILPSGRVLESGEPGEDAIFSVSLNESVNSDNELMLGASFANILDATIWNSGGGLKLSAGDTVQLESNGQSDGFFTLERPVRASANTIKITGYDCVTKLDKDLTSWFLFFAEGWPYTAKELAEDVCKECGLTVTFPYGMINGDFPIPAALDKEMTGRKILHWIAEICGCFFRASRTVKNQIEFDWYDEQVKREIQTDQYYKNGLSYDDYIVAPIEGVQVKYSHDDTLWPSKDELLNKYIIEGNVFLSGSTVYGTDEDGNPLFPGVDKDTLLPYLQNLEAHLINTTSYVPFKISMPRSGMTDELIPGSKVRITDRNGVSFESVVMTRKRSGSKVTMEATGSPRRDSISVTNNPSGSGKPVSQQLNQAEIFNILTNSGNAAGLLLRNGQLYFSPNYIAKYLFPSKDGTAYFDLENNIIGTKDGTSVAALSGGGFGIFDNGELVLQIKNEADSVSVAGYGKAVNIAAPTLKINNKTVSWVDNGDGSYTMTGK